MHVQLKDEPEVCTQLNRIATLTSLEFSSSQAGPLARNPVLSSPCSVILFL